MVYLRAKSFERKNNKKKRTYYYIVDSIRENGKVKQRVLLYLGTADQIHQHYLKLENKENV